MESLSKQVSNGSREPARADFTSMHCLKSLKPKINTPCCALVLNLFAYKLYKALHV